MKNSICGGINPTRWEFAPTWVVKNSTDRVKKSTSIEKESTCTGISPAGREGFKDLSPRKSAELLNKTAICGILGKNLANSAVRV
ncbi:MAG TPA: hypothetical protein VNG71_04215 [Pyrinomonadaceae bacterium]|nr:hypothetical protein [Pyrinomonadaceae bacterium]